MIMHINAKTIVNSHSTELPYLSSSFNTLGNFCLKPFNPFNRLHPVKPTLIKYPLQINNLHILHPIPIPLQCSAIDLGFICLMTFAMCSSVLSLSLLPIPQHILSLNTTFDVQHTWSLFIRNNSFSSKETTADFPFIMWKALHS